jgi:hypothetical protein
MGMTSAGRRDRHLGDCLGRGTRGSWAEPCSGSPSASASVRMNSTTWSMPTPARRARCSTCASTGSLSRTNRLSQGRTLPAMRMSGAFRSPARFVVGVSELAAGLRRVRNPASKIGGAEGSRTPDPKTASLVLSQLSYSPTEEPRYRPVAGVVKEGVVPVRGVEPLRPFGHRILSPDRLPVPTHRHAAQEYPHFPLRMNGSALARLRARQGTSGEGYIHLSSRTDAFFEYRRIQTGRRRPRVHLTWMPPATLSNL